MASDKINVKKSFIFVNSIFLCFNISVSFILGKDLVNNYDKNKLDSLVALLFNIIFTLNYILNNTFGSGVTRLIMHYIKYGESEVERENLTGHFTFTKHIFKIIHMCTLLNFILLFWIFDLYFSEKTESYKISFEFIFYYYIIIFSLFGLVFTCIFLVACSGCMLIAFDCNGRYRNHRNVQNLLNAIQEINRRTVASSTLSNFINVNNTNEEGDPIVCPICQENIPPNKCKQAPCHEKHIFCEDCLNKLREVALETGDFNCPLCRSNWVNTSIV